MKLIYWLSLVCCLTASSAVLFYDTFLSIPAQALNILTEPFKLSFSRSFIGIISNNNLTSKNKYFHEKLGVNLTTLYYFNGDNKSGKNPVSGLVFYKDFLYGATRYGANRNGYAGIFKFNLTSKTLTQLHTFTPTEESFGSTQTVSKLTSDKKGSFYGTTYNGGSHGQGTVFKITSNGSHTILHSFKGLEDGRSPTCQLSLDPLGNLFGSVYGQIFKLGPKNKLLILARLATRQGTSIEAGVVRDANNNLYTSASSEGKYGGGSLIKLNHNRQLFVLHSFQGKEGIFPVGGVIRDSEGNLFGTTSQGGAYGKGTVFKFSFDKKLYILHNFNGGSINESRIGLIRDSAGNLYGSYQNEIFQIATDGTYTSLYEFTGFESYFTTGLVISNGALYGTNYAGGLRTPRCGDIGCGAIFKLSLSPRSPVRKHSKSPILQLPPENLNKY